MGCEPLSEVDFPQSRIHQNPRECNWFNRTSACRLSKRRSPTLDSVRTGIREGKSEEAILGTTKPLKGFPDHGPLIKRVLQAACTEVKA